MEGVGRDSLENRGVAALCNRNSNLFITVGSVRSKQALTETRKKRAEREDVRQTVVVRMIFKPQVQGRRNEVSARVGRQRQDACDAVCCSTST